eukprot:3882472-Pleurochrysis_carterae.AAC.2
MHRHCSISLEQGFKDATECPTPIHYARVAQKCSQKWLPRHCSAGCRRAEASAGRLYLTARATAKRRSATLAAPPYLRFVWRRRS